jgi:hypothetical protein
VKKKGYTQEQFEEKNVQFNWDFYKHNIISKGLFWEFRGQKGAFYTNPDPPERAVRSCANAMGCRTGWLRNIGVLEKF